MLNMLLSKPLLNQDPSSTITHHHPHQLHTRWFSEYCLWVIDVGGYRRTSNGSILANSAFGQALWSLTLKLPADLPLPGADHRGPQPHVFVADEAFPLRKNLMRPFPGGTGPSIIVCPKLGWWWRMPLGFFLPSEGCTGVPLRFIQKLRRTVRATCVLHNFLWGASQAPAMRGNIPVGEVEQLSGLGGVAANNHAREAIRVREVFTSYFSAEGAVPWQDDV